MIYILLANLYLAIFYTFYYLFLRKETFFSLNRYYLLSALLLSFLLPLANVPEIGKSVRLSLEQYAGEFATQYGQYLELNPGMQEQSLQLIADQAATSTLPEGLMTVSPQTDLSQFYGTRSADLSGSGVPSWWQPAFILQIYIIGCLLAFFLFLIRLGFTVAAIRNRNKPKAFSFFHLVCVSKDIEGYEDVLRHEHAHAREWHSLDIMLIQIARIFNWFNPFVYAMERSFKLQHEYQADRMAADQNQVAYAELLLATAMNVPVHSLNNQFINPSLLKSRIMMLLKNKTPKKNLAKFALVLPVVLGMIIFSSACNPSNKSAEDQEASDVTEVRKAEFDPVADENQEADSSHVNLPPPVEPPPPSVKPAPPKMKPVTEKKDQVRMPEYAVVPTPKKKDRTAGSDLDPEKAIRIEKTVTQRSDLAAENAIRIGDPLGDEKVLFLYEEIEIQPKIIGVGDQTFVAFSNWFHQNLNVPQAVIDNQFRGTVKATFIIDENGKLTNIEIQDDPGYGLAEAITRTLEKSPDWLAGVQNGKKVRTKITLPVRFDTTRR